MSEPRRWLEGGADAPEGARELLEHAPRSQAIDKAALAASAAALAKLSATPAVAAAAAVSLPIKLAASIALVTVAGATAFELTRAPAPEAYVARPAAPKAASAGPIEHPSVEPQALGEEPAEPIAPLGPMAPVVASDPAPSLGGEPALLPEAIVRAPTPDAVTPRLARPRARARSEKPQPLAKPELAEVEPQATAEPPVQAAEPRVEATERAPEPEPSVAEAPKPPPELDALAAEVRWLERARALLPSDPGAALRHAGEHRTRFPDGSLVAERELIAVEALQRLGRHAEAERRGQALLKRFPGSLYRERLRSLFH